MEARTMKIKLALGLALFAVVTTATAQTTTGSQFNETEEIFNTSKRKVERGEKLPDKPAYRDTVIQAPKINYAPMAAQASTNINPEPLKAANIVPKELLDKLYKFYVKAGVGNYTNVLGEVYFNQERNATTDYGVYYKHFSSQGGINDVAFNGFSTNDALVYGSKLFKNYRAAGQLNYKRDALHYFGFNPDSFAIDKTKTLQLYNTIGVKFNGNTTYNSDSTKIAHQERFGYRAYFDNRGAVDHNAAFTLSGGQRYKKEYYALNFTADYNYFNDDSCNCLTQFKEPLVYRCFNQQNNLILGLNPTVTTQTENLKIKVGLIVNADIYSSGKFYFFPDVELSYSLFNDMFIPYAGVNRSIIRNSLYTLSQQNPFMLTNNDYINTNQKLNVYGGIKGTWSSNLSFNSKISYSRNENMALFVVDTLFSMENRFVVDYDDIDILTADAHILYRGGSKWHFLFGGTYYKYNTLNAEFAWHLPDFKVYSTLVYNLKDKLIARYNLEVLGTRKGYTYNTASGGQLQPDGKYIFNLKPFFDTDIHLEYRYTKRFSVFAQFNNLAGRYLRWTNYPMQAFNIMGGLTYMF